MTKIKKKTFRQNEKGHQNTAQKNKDRATYKLDLKQSFYDLDRFY